MDVALSQTRAPTRTIAFIWLLSFISPTTTSVAAIFGPDTYEECLTSSMKGVTSNVAARTIIQACSKQFPPEPAVAPKAVARPLEAVPNDVLERLEARFLIVEKATGNHIGEVCNGNRGWRIQELIIRVDSPRAGGRPGTQRDYRIEVDARALEKTLFDFNPFVQRDEDWTWSIIAARGTRGP